MSALIRNRLQYVFSDEQLLRSALRSAHRERDDDVLDDGNRGLAHYGNLAIQMAMTHDAIIDHGRTVHDINAQQHWSKSRKTRANACRLLGIDALVMRSVRQQHQPPSDTVLDHAFSAVIGAIWLDCEHQEQKVSHMRSTVLNVLRLIDAIVDHHSIKDGCVSCAEESMNPLGSQPEIECADQSHCDGIDKFIREWFEQELHHGSPSTIFPQDPPSELQRIVTEDDRTLSLESDSVDEHDESNSTWNDRWLVLENAERHRTHLFDPESAQEPLSRSTEDSHYTQTKEKGSKRKREHHENERASYLYHSVLQAEQEKLIHYSQVDQQDLHRFLRHPSLDKLEGRGAVPTQFLYLAIGSWETIQDFEDLSLMRKSICGPPSISPCNATAVYEEICRLEKEEALCILLRRYYIIKLCEEEDLYNDHHGRIIVETPGTIDGGRVTKPGNPILALESNLTDRLLFKIMPYADRDSADFQKVRAKIKRLRRLAGRLRHLVRRYGFGILGLLPSGPSFHQMSLTDSMCVPLEMTSCAGSKANVYRLTSITETMFHEFALILDQEQGSHLSTLSRFIEPYVLSIVTGSVDRDTTCFRDWVHDPFLAGLPKGLLMRRVPTEL